MFWLQLEESRVYREAMEVGQLEGWQEGRQEGWQKGWQEGRQQEAFNLVLRLLVRRVGKLSDDQKKRISNLPLSKLEDLSEALLDFSSLDNLSTWLSTNGTKKS
ncbi:DUF4351 domain-containing protein [Aerosakkonemataceae cyanobacterium BLCC-F50]|uniref:DUF4351 domain-containing protein n=1 Tax=Floridaenema flaviceps BLCC-F50 TaxID=3153642 RepID=A0ABV4XX16_9CYAN